jgi:N-glycosylase/DNA lyase
MQLSQELQTKYIETKTAIRARLDDFARVAPEDYFYEMAYCILTPQSKAEGAEKAIEILRARDFFAERFDSSDILKRFVRFHNTKSQRLIEIANNFTETEYMLKQGSNPYDERKWLVENIKGFGMKEASHFLRNIGRRHLAILDRHILNRLAESGCIPENTKVGSTKMYLEIESKMVQLSEEVCIDMDELDLLFWSANTGVIRK